MIKPENCRHHNIQWEDLFKSEKQNNWDYQHQNAYCVDCGTDKGRIFANNVQRWYRERIKEWLINNNLTEEFAGHHSEFKFIEFVKKNSYEDWWNKLCLGKIDEDFNGPFGQGHFWEVARSIETLCYEFKQEQQQNTPNQSLPPKLRRKKNQNNPDTPIPTNSHNPSEEEETPQQPPSSPNSPKPKPNNRQSPPSKEKPEAPITNNPTNTQNDNKNQWIKPALIIGGGLLITGLIIYLIAKNKKKER